MRSHYETLANGAVEKAYKETYKAEQVLASDGTPAVYYDKPANQKKKKYEHVY